MNTSSTVETMSVASFLSKFNASINQIRNILRREGVTGMDSMKHVTLYILCRTLDESECEKLKIGKKFAWERFQELMEEKKTQELYDLMYCKTGIKEDLITHLDRLFGTRNFNFKITNLTNHSDILHIVKDIDFKHLDGHVDILGTVYEHHLGSGSNKSAMRDLGQFFTDRKVCNYMVKLCDPKLLSDNRAESVLDPTMGTGGFLTSYVKHYQTTGKQIDWHKMQMDVAGYDIDEFVMSIGRINMYLSTGVLFDRIAHRDTLSRDVGEQTQRLKFDVILANMPFGVKGLVFKDACKRVKEQHCDGTKSEPLFLNLMMAALEIGGRCAVVVPDGMLVNCSNQHNSTRKYLLDHFELKRVVKMKGQFFTNTGIQPSILFFENTGKPTEIVEFWDVEENDKHEILESKMVSVPRERIDGSSSLDMRRYVEAEKPVANVGGYPLVKLGDILQGVKGSDIITLEKAIPGDYQLYSASIDIKTHNTATFDKTESIIQACVGSNLVNCIHYTNYPFATTANLWVLRLKNKSAILKFVYYYLKLTKIVLNKVNTSVLPKINKSEFDEIKIPLPPLSIQNEIVASLDRIYNPGTTELTSKLKEADSVLESKRECEDVHKLVRKSAQLVPNVTEQMIADVKSQMIAIMKSVERMGYPKLMIKDISSIESGTYITKSEAFSEGFPIYGGGDACNYYSEKSNRSDRLVIAKDGVSLKCVRWVSGSFHLNHHGWTLKCNDKIIEKYLYYTLMTQQQEIYSMASGSAQKGINQKTMEQFSIIVPPISLQESILNRLEALQSQLTALESLQRQSDDNARFILESYLTTSSVVESIAPSDEDITDKTSVVSEEESVQVRVTTSCSNAATPDYKAMSLNELKQCCKDKKIKGTTGKKKEELIEMLMSSC